jgi:iron complex outermembrane recepter protein
MVACLFATLIKGDRVMKKTAAVSLLAAEAAVLMSVSMANAAEPSNVQLEEIVVVAQRREQSLLDVPVSATVFDAGLIEAAGYDDAKDYLLQTPNVAFMQGGNNGAREIIISIRGVSDLKGSEKVLTQSAFATYVDEFAAGTLASGQSNPDTYDLEGIEILRGPQGVFFGRNSEGGAINIRSKKPTPDFYGRVDAGVGRFNTFELGGVVNGALSEHVFGRLTAHSETSDGPIENRHANGGGSDTQYVHVRGQLRWEPTEATTVDFQVNHTIDNIGIVPKIGSCIDQSAFGLPYTLATSELLGGVGCYDANDEFSNRVKSGEIVLPAGVTLADIRDNRDSVYQDTVDHTNNKISMAILKLYQELGDAMALTSISGYSQSEQDQFLDLDRSGIKAINRDNGYETRAFSQELRLSSIGSGRRIDWTVGGLYYRENYDAMNQILIEQVLGPWVPGDKANENTISNKVNGWAAFGNLEWHMTDSLSLIAGGRYSRDHGENEWDNVYAACGRRTPGAALDTSHAAEGNGPCLLTPDQQLLADRGGLPQYWTGTRYVVTGGRYEQILGRFAENDTDDFSPRLALNWRPSEDSSIYVSASKGYKPGGGNGNPDGLGSTVFEGEQMWNYEIGGNAYLFDRRLLLQGAVFYMDWKDFQFQSRLQLCVLPDGSTVVADDDFDLGQCANVLQQDTTTNQPKARTKGVELSSVMRVTDGLTVSGSYGYLDAKFEEGVGIINDVPTDISGFQIGNAPKITAAATIEQAFPLLGGDAAVALNWSYRGEAALGAIETLTQDFPTHVDAFSLFNLRLTHKWGKNRISINVDNLLDDEYYTASVGFSFVGPQLSYNPRTWSMMWTSEFE